MTMLSLYVFFFFFFSSRRRHTRFDCDWSSDVCSSDLRRRAPPGACASDFVPLIDLLLKRARVGIAPFHPFDPRGRDRKSTRLNSSHSQISYAVFCLKKKKKKYSRRIRSIRYVVPLSTP